MATTAITATARFFQPEISKVYFVPTIADIASPTRVELDAGDDLTAEISDIQGFSLTSNFIDTPDLGHRFVSQIPGSIKADQSSLTFYGDKTGDDVRSVLPRETAGYLVFMDTGDVATQPMDVFPIEVASVGKLRRTSDNAYQLTIMFAITAVPQENVAIPAAA